MNQVVKALEGCDAVIHLAGYSNPSLNNVRELDVYQNNVMALYNVLLAAGLGGIHRIAIASSDSAIGITWNYNIVTPQYLPVDEEHPASPDNCYGLSKVTGELIASGMARRFNMSVASWRITWVVVPTMYDTDFAQELPHNPEAFPWNL